MLPVVNVISKFSRRPLHHHVAVIVPLTLLSNWIAGFRLTPALLVDVVHGQLLGGPRRQLIHSNLEGSRSAMLRSSRSPRASASTSGERRWRGENFMYSRKSNIRLHELDVQEANAIGPFGNCFVGCWFENGRATTLELWDVVIEVSRSSKITESPTHGAAGNSSRTHKSKPKQKGNRDVDELFNVDHVVTNAQSSQGASSVVHL